MRGDLATFHRRKSGGHYARLMGTLWRHLKAQEAGDAALGMWMRMLSYCADVGRQVLTKREMAVLMAGDKNGPRKLAALINARLVDRIGDEYTPHDWFDHNPGTRRQGEENDGATGGERDQERESAARDGEANVTGNVTGNVSKPPEQNQDVTPPLSRPRTQEVREENATRSPCAREESPWPKLAEPPIGSPEPPEFEAGEPFAPRSDRESLEAFVRRRFASRFADRMTYPPSWSPANVQHIRTLATWLEQHQGADPRGVCEKLLESWFSDSWVQSAHYPLSDLASRPHRYLGDGAGGLEAMQAKARKLLAANKLDEWRVLNAEIVKLQGRRRAG